MNDFVKVLVVWLSLLAMFALGFFTIGAKTGTQGDPIWLKLVGALAVGPGIMMLVGLPIYRNLRRGPLSREVIELLNQARFADARERMRAATQNWADWSEGWMLLGTAEMWLWQIDAAGKSFAKAVKTVDSLPPSETLVLRSLMVAELLGTEEERLQNIARLNEYDLTFPEMIRAARVGDWAKVRTLMASRSMQIQRREFNVLAEALFAWSMESTNPRAVNKVKLLGETSIEPIQKFWPEFAAFIERAPTA